MGGGGCSSFCKISVSGGRGVPGVAECHETLSLESDLIGIIIELMRTIILIELIPTVYQKRASSFLI